MANEETKTQAGETNENDRAEEQAEATEDMQDLEPKKDVKGGFVYQ